MSTIVSKISEWEEQKEGKPFFSFEYFPPKTEKGVENLYARLKRMKELDPLFIDFTWGAGGSTSDLTADLSIQSKKRFDYEVNMHLTCTNMALEKVIEALDTVKAADVRNICALRGDPPAGQERWTAGSSGFTCGRDLIKYIRDKHGDFFGIQVAGYPEGHPDVIKPVGDRELSESEKSRVVHIEVDGELVPHVCSDEDYKKDLQYLKSKIDAGGQVIISQLFYDTDLFIQWVKDCRAEGITAPIIPGIMPILKLGGFKRMTTLCKTRIPQKLREALEKFDEKDTKGLSEFGIQLGIEMCTKLIENGVKGLHFYTLNLEKSTVSILRGLKLIPTPTPAPSPAGA